MNNYHIGGEACLLYWLLKNKEVGRQGKIGLWLREREREIPKATLEDKGEIKLGEILCASI